MSISVTKVIKLFYEESSDLALASEKVILEACERTNNGDIWSRWNDYQEEIRIMMFEEFRECF